MFDPSKLDISDEFKSVIEELQPHEDKVHCVLNKADNLDTESLMRVYGALRWSMGKVFKGAEVTRVYVGSFRDEPLTRKEHAALFEKDRTVLLGRLHDLPRACGMRKVNEMVKRIRLAIVNVCVLGHLRSKMPYLWGREAAQQKLIDSLPEVFESVRRQYGLAEGDFPKIDEFRQVLRMSDFRMFPHTSRDVLTKLQELLLEDIPRIISNVAGVVKEGPGAAADASEKDDDDDDETEENKLVAEVKSRLKVPKLFTITENTSEANKVAMIVTFSAIVAVIVAVLVAYYVDNFASVRGLQSQLDTFFAASTSGTTSTSTEPKV
jgi:EH domain-containing protein 1